MIAQVGTPWVFYVVLEGELPPAGSFCRMIFYNNGQEIRRSEGQFYARGRFLQQSVDFPEQWWLENAGVVRPDEYGNPPIDAPDLSMPNVAQDVQTQIVIEFWFFDSEKEKWYRATSATRSVRVSCPQCRPKIY